MKLFNVAVVLLVALAINSCVPYIDPGSSITSPIILSNKQHHVGDNEGAEGLTLYAEFEMPKNFKYAELDITFVHPDEHGTSGPDVETPPEITINGYKIGAYSEDFKLYPECITEDDEFQCSIIFTYDITDVLFAGENVFRITSMVYIDNYNDFTFSDVVIRFE